MVQELQCEDKDLLLMQQKNVGCQLYYTLFGFLSFFFVFVISHHACVDVVLISIIESHKIF